MQHAFDAMHGTIATAPAARVHLDDWMPQVGLEQGLLLTIADLRARLGSTAMKRAP